MFCIIIELISPLIGHLNHSFFCVCTYTDIWMNIFKGFLHFELFISLEVKYWRKEFDDFNTEKI